MSRFVLIALAVGGCAGPVTDPEQGAAFVESHNQRRLSPVPTPEPSLAPLAFDGDLSRTAQAWSAGCVFEHSTGDLGENLAFLSGQDSTPEDAVGLWADEDAFYDYDTNACAPGEVCGHYTQIVWRDTQRVGCGSSTCTIDGFEGLFWVCNYDPPGNFVGERPY